MPLEKAAVGTPGFGHNIATEIKSGKSPAQAAAIAYAKARGDAYTPASGEHPWDALEKNAVSKLRQNKMDSLLAAADALFARSDAMETGRWDGDQMSGEQIRNSDLSKLKDIYSGLVRGNSDRMSRGIAHDELERRGYLKKRF